MEISATKSVLEVFWSKEFVKHRNFSMTDENGCCFQKTLKFGWWKKKERKVNENENMKTK